MPVSTSGHPDMTRVAKMLPWQCTLSVLILSRLSRLFPPCAHRFHRATLTDPPLDPNAPAARSHPCTALRFQPPFTIVTMMRCFTNANPHNGNHNRNAYTHAFVFGLLSLLRGAAAQTGGSCDYEERGAPHLVPAIGVGRE